MKYENDLLKHRGHPDIDWHHLLRHTHIYAASHINRWLWRGSIGGILPDGFDPSSIAAEAVHSFFSDPNLNLPLNLNPETVLRDLERRVRTIINRLHHRKENCLLRNEPDLAPLTYDDGEAVSIIELIPDPSPHPDQTLLDKESHSENEAFRIAATRFLAGDTALLGLFNALYQGVSRRSVLAQRLNLPPAAVKSLRERLMRRLAKLEGCGPFRDEDESFFKKFTPN